MIFCIFFLYNLMKILFDHTSLNTAVELVFIIFAFREGNVACSTTSNRLTCNRTMMTYWGFTVWTRVNGIFETLYATWNPRKYKTSVKHRKIR